MKSDMAALDLIEELRLRRWARQNYVPEASRSAKWHPVVLNEMRLKDLELNELDGAFYGGKMLVPIRDLRILRIDEPHDALRGPRSPAPAVITPSEFHYA